jgi:hypothetical protein
MYVCTQLESTSRVNIILAASGWTLHAIMVSPDHEAGLFGLVDKDPLCSPCACQYVRLLVKMCIRLAHMGCTLYRCGTVGLDWLLGTTYR